MGTASFLAVDGLTNLRDLGGYRAEDGAWVRRGRVYRSDSPHLVSSDGAETLRSLGIVTVLDLRSNAERDEFPGPLPSTHHPIQEDVERDGIDPRTVSGRDGGEQLLADLYVLLLERSALRYGQVLEALSDEARLPALVHCHAGKDRTGLAVALLLSALGVDRDTVLDDYATSPSGDLHASRLVDAHAHFVGRGMEASAAHGMLSAPRWAMGAALNELDQRYGSVAAYLEGPCGLQPETLVALRAALLERGEPERG